MNTTIKSKTVEYIEFTEEQMQQLNIKEGDQFTIEVEDDCIKLVPFQSVEIDLSDFDRHFLEYLIKVSVERNVSVNDIIVEIIEEAIK